MGMRQTLDDDVEGLAPKAVAVQAPAAAGPRGQGVRQAEAPGDRARGRAVTYRSRLGDLLEANVVFESAGTAAIDVRIPGCSEPLRLTRIPISEADTGWCGTCFAKVAACYAKAAV